MAKEIAQLVKNLDSFSDGQLKVLEVDLDESQWITLEVKPNAGPYKGGAYQFKVEPSNVTALTPLFHPNINGTHVCMDVDDEVADSYGQELLVVGLLYILQKPNYNDAYGFWMELDEKKAYRNIRLSLTGRKVGGFEGPTYIEDDDEILQFLEEFEKEEEEKRRKEEEEQENQVSGDEIEPEDLAAEGSDLIPDDNVPNTEVSQENATNPNNHLPSEASESPIPDPDMYTATSEPGNSVLDDSTSQIETIPLEAGSSTSSGVRSHLERSPSHSEVLPTFASLTLKETQQASPDL